MSFLNQADSTIGSGKTLEVEPHENLEVKKTH